MKTAFAQLDNLALLRAWFVFKLCSWDWLVQHSQQLLGLSGKVLGSRLTLGIVRRTFFAHFCAGETADEVEVKMRQLRSMGVGSILDYAAEADVAEVQKEVPEAVLRDVARIGVVSARTYDYLGEAKCDANVQTFLDCIDAAARQADGFTAIKLTALGKPEFLERVSKILNGIRATFHEFASGGAETISFEQFRVGITERLGLSLEEEDLRSIFEHFDRDSNGTIDYLEWTSVLDLNNLHHSKLFFADPHSHNKDSLHLLTKSGKIPLIDEDEAKLIHSLTDRLQTIAKAAAEKKVKLLIDAEQSYLQPAIDHFTCNLQRLYNREQPIVFNTYQAYLINARSHMAADLLRSQREGFWFAGKLVRGAYMVLERHLAKENNYLSPILPDKQATDASYNNLADLILRNHARATVMIATHNQHSIYLATELMRTYNIEPAGPVYFAQLLGMSDILSFNLGAKGYHVYKYVPYGPVNEVIPYLLRRAQENSDMLSFAQVERELCWKELCQRKFFFRPSQQ
ncbi:MAG: proline dehydrogenase family protein [archaeon]|nr:proline dehydrogenase family protein [archaeon]